MSTTANEEEKAGASSGNANEEEEHEPEKEEWEIQRDHHKSQADNAFRCGGFKTAIDEYTKAIELDPEFLVGYSNRSAAYLKNSETSKALKDAEKCVAMDPSFAKGHSRLAAALHSLRRYEKALESYQTVLSLDPTNAVAKKGVNDCQTELDKRRQHEKNEKDKKDEKSKEETTAEPDPASKDEKKDDDEDDLLDDFFADVEEVVKKKDDDEPEKPKATNKVKHDKQVLGTSEGQMERLLQNNHEWRNLNPFYVLQLPHDATDDDISRRYKALSLMLHPDKNGGSERAQQAFDQVKKAKTTLSDPDRAKHARMLLEEGMKQGHAIFKTNKKLKLPGTLQECQEKEVMRIFAQVEQKRREVEQRERKFQQREQQQEDDVLEQERKARQFDKSWRKEERVDKRVGNWRDFAKKKKSKN